MQLGEENSFHLLIHAQINGETCPLVLDTGASMSVFDRKRFRKCALKTTPDLQMSGVSSGRLRARLGNFASFKIGELEWNNLPIVLFSMTSVHKAYQRFTDLRVAGLIGSDFLQQHRAIINYGNKTLSLAKKESK